jgi:hypothetical protein
MRPHLPARQSPPRSRTGHRVTGLLVVLAAAVLMASCSSDTNDQAATPTTPAPPATAPPTTRTPYQPPGTGRPSPTRTTGTAPATPAVVSSAAISAAVAKAVPTVVAQADAMDAPTLLVASNIGATYGIPELAALRGKAIEKFATEPPIDQLVLYLTSPMYRRMVFPDAPVTAGDVALLPTSDSASRTQWVWSTAFTCDSPAFPPEWSQRVRDLMAQESKGGYTASHAGLGLLSLLERGCTLPDADALRNDIVTKVQSFLPTPFNPDDNALEAGVVLQLLGRADLVSPDWITKTLDAQLPDGSWARKATSPDTKGTVKDGVKGDWHTTLLAIWFLEAVRNPQATGPFFS